MLIADALHGINQLVITDRRFTHYKQNDILNHITDNPLPLLTHALWVLEKE
jgi:hypothetical protein